MDIEKITRKDSYTDKKSQKPTRQDTLNIMNSQEIIKMLHDGGIPKKKNPPNPNPLERLIWSGEISKINRRKSRQTRRFLLTNKRFFNLGTKTIVENILAFFKGSIEKRCIKILDIEYITYSIFSNEWVIHVPKEYDYR
jgi:hypothetical protein